MRTKMLYRIKIIFWVEMALFVDFVEMAKPRNE